MERHRRLKYGLSPEAYAAMIAAQQNKCAICERQMGKAPGTIFVDDPNWWKWWVWRFMPPGEERDEYARRAFESLKPETQEQLRKEYKPRIRVRARTAS